MACISSLYQAKPIRELEVGSMLLLIFQVLKNSPRGTSYLILLRSTSHLSRHHFCTRWSSASCSLSFIHSPRGGSSYSIVSSRGGYFHSAYSCLPRQFPCKSLALDILPSTRRIRVPYIREGDSYPSCSARQICIFYAPRGGSRMMSLIPLEFSCPLEVLIFLLEVVAC